MPFFYKTGEQIHPGDRVRLNDVAGEIELVADPTNDPKDWYVTEFGGGVMFTEPKMYGRLFIKLPPDENHNQADELVFLSRGPQHIG